MLIHDAPPRLGYSNQTVGYQAANKSRHWLATFTLWPRKQPFARSQSMKLFIYSVLLILVCSTSAMSGETPTKTYEQINSNVTAENIKFFEDHLAKCPENESRCLWFLSDHIKVGMVMTLDLQKYSVHSVREVYDWASQGAETRKLSHSQVVTAKEILITLPRGTEKVPFGKGVHLAFWRDGKLQAVTYDRSAVPIVLQRLYDIGGGYLDCASAK